MASEKPSTTNEGPTNNLAFIEPNTHSFVVKIWLEEEADPTNHSVWRGHITHVASGRRRYIRSIGSVLHFIWSYLRAFQVVLPLRDRLCLWMNRLR